jgi:hypothetical protein
MTEKKELTFHDKLNRVQVELNCPKNLYNKFGNYKYRNAESILEGVKPLLDEYNLILVINDEPVVIGDRFYIKATAEIGDLNSKVNSVAYAREPESKKGMDPSQITGATSSYARKYALNGLLCIDDNQDADSMDNSKEGKTTSIAKKISKVVDNDMKEVMKESNLNTANIIKDKLMQATSKDDVEDICGDYKSDISKLYKHDTTLFNEVKELKDNLLTQLQ